MSEIKASKDLNELKVKIKKWEGKFFQLNNRKPGKEDMKNSTPKIQECYRKYWHLRRLVEKDKRIFNKEDDDVFGSIFNKSSDSTTLKTKHVSSTLKHYSRKLGQYEKKQDILEKTLVIKSPTEEINNEIRDSDNSIISSVLDETSEKESDKNEVFHNANLTDLSNNNSKVVLKINNSVLLQMSEPKKFRFTRPVNICSTKISNGNQNRNLYAKNKIDLDWLDRCTIESRISEDFSRNKENCKQDLKSKCLEDNQTAEKSNDVANKETENNGKEKVLFYNSECDYNNSKFNFKHNYEEKEINQNNKITNVSNTTVFITGGKITDDIHSSPQVSFVSSIESSCFDFQEKRNSNFKIFSTDIKKNMSGVLDKKPNISKKTMLADKTAHLKRKLSTNTVNENYVKINIKKKKFVRGHKHITIQKYKKQKWKIIQKKRNNNSINGEAVSAPSASSCFNCGKLGHWAKNCPEKKTGLSELALDDNDNDSVSLPTLAEAKALARGLPLSNTITRIMPKEETNDGVESVLRGIEFTQVQNNSLLEETQTNQYSMFNLDSNGQIIETPSRVYEALNEIGYSAFRPGQEEAIMRILSGLSTLVISPTGSGKSLCYQLPAYIYSKTTKRITLVVSPLLSLMEDQITGLPRGLKAVCLHSGMTATQREQSLDAIGRGKAQILLLSPEAIVGSGNSNVLLTSKLPPIAFACIDEAHCLSEWSHNFRPSYLQLQKVLVKKLGIKCLLALTATATKSTASDIAHHLGLSDKENAVIGKTTIPENLLLSVSCPKYRDLVLIDLLKCDTFNKCKSIIVYCTRRDDTEKLASLIRTRMQDFTFSTAQSTQNNKKQLRNRFLSWNAEAYHAGLSAARRKTIQNSFMSGKLRIVVATVAFGMGLNKSNVHGIIHYNVPKSFESYVQEIGRAGRDKLPSYCHLFLEPDGYDICELRRHIYANSMDRHVIRKLLKKVFGHKRCNQLQSDVCEDSEKNVKSFGCPGHEVSIPINSTVQDLDVKEENLSTLLCYLELYYQNYFEVFQPVYETCAIKCYKGYKQLVATANKCPPLAVAIALNQQKDVQSEITSRLRFSVIDVAAEMNWDSKLVKKALKNLEWDTSELSGGGRVKRTGIVVEFSDLAFHMKVCCDIAEEKQDEILEFLYGRVVTQEKFELNRVQKVYELFKSVASSVPNFDLDQSNLLKQHLQNYFESDSRMSCDKIQELNNLNEMKPDKMDEIRSTICNLICTHHDRNFTGRAIAQILHGISSPCYPAEVWGRVRKFWRSHLDVDFHFLNRIANEEIVRMR